MALAVHLRSAVAVIGQFPVLAGADLDVATGEVVLVRGPNGAGKTSLLRVCAGLVPVVSGQASVLGVDLRRDRRSVRRQVFMLAHTGFLYEDLTVEENVRFAVRAGGGDIARIDPALGRLGLAGAIRDVAVSKLSTGQRRRAAIATLAARSPRLWLLDEPHAGLDVEGRETLDAMVLEAVDAGATVLLASHEGERALALAGRAVTMAGGRVSSQPAREPLHVA